MMGRALGLACLFTAVVSCAAVAEVSQVHLMELADLATQDAGILQGWVVVSPFLLELNASAVGDAELLYPSWDLAKSQSLAAVCGWIEWMQQTVSASVLVICTLRLQDSFDVRNEVERVAIGDATFEPGIPICVEVRISGPKNPITGASSTFAVYAIPLPGLFLDALKASTPDTVVGVDLAYSDSTIEFRLDEELETYIVEVNGLAAPSSE